MDAALEKFTAELKKNPQDAQTWMARGLLHLVKQKNREAVQDFTEFVQLRPRDPRGYANRAIAWKRKGEYDIAIGDYNEAIRLNPKSAQTWHNRGYVWLIKGDYEKALADQDEAIAIDPQSFDSYNTKAWILATCPDESLRDGKQAVEYARQACKLCGHGHWYCRGTLAAAYAETGEFEKAAELARQCLKEAPSQEQAKVREQLLDYQEGHAYHTAPVASRTVTSFP